MLNVTVTACSVLLNIERSFMPSPFLMMNTWNRNSTGHGHISVSLCGPSLVSLVDRFSGAFGRRFFIPRVVEQTLGALVTITNVLINRVYES